MTLKDFLEVTHNKWIKIKMNDTTIIQNVTSYKPINLSTSFECEGYSISNPENEILELKNFYMTTHHKDGFVTELSPSEAEVEIQAMKG